ncbi:hypothetical protein [Nonomuraea sp. NPDC049129]|uniref:hypothetical protein n=1 Tax=Nonomuraea sp. NPDC049129 TaxID=3155272 RepID=UPI0033E9E195
MVGVHALRVAGAFPRAGGPVERGGVVQHGRDALAQQPPEPYGIGSGTVRDNLVPASLEVIAYKGKKLRVPVPGNVGGVLTPDAIRDYLRSALTAVTTVPLTQVDFFASKLVTFVTSGPRRRLGQWENMGFADFIKASIMSQEYRDLLVRLFTASLVAAQPNKANTRTMGLMFEALVYSGLGLGPYGPPDRVLGGPSNDVWLTPWIGYLTSLGVQFKVGWSATGFDYSGGRITGARVSDPSGAAGTVTADHYVAALPVERLRPLLTSAMKAADPALARLDHLETDWMNGVMIYLKEPRPIANGHLIYAARRGRSPRSARHSSGAATSRPATGTARSPTACPSTSRTGALPVSCSARPPGSAPGRRSSRRSWLRSVRPCPVVRRCHRAQ